MLRNIDRVLSADRTRNLYWINIAMLIILLLIPLSRIQKPYTCMQKLGFKQLMNSAQAMTLSRM